ncbi:MAG: hypothetical protein M1821_004787 [Bathelium mastoideum]|nr:MAG: hypothetical protein M1821_004787 [Bathelium mastoideum]
MKLFGNPNAGKKNKSRAQPGSQEGVNNQGQGNSGSSSFTTGPTGPHGFPSDQKYNPSTQQQKVPNVPPPAYTDSTMAHAGPSTPRFQPPRQGQNAGVPQMQPPQRGYPRQYSNIPLQQQPQQPQPGPSSAQHPGRQQPNQPPTVPLPSASQFGGQSEMGDDDDTEFEFPYKEPQVEGASNPMQQSGTIPRGNQSMMPYQNYGVSTQMPQQGQAQAQTPGQPMMSPGSMKMASPAQMMMQPTTMMAPMTIGVPVPQYIPIPQPVPIMETVVVAPLRPLLPRVHRLIRAWRRGMTLSFPPMLEAAIESELALLHEAAFLHDHEDLTPGERRYIWARTSEVAHLVRVGPAWGVDYGWLGTDGGPMELDGWDDGVVRGWWGDLRGRPIYELVW